MQVIRDFAPADRYTYDFGVCSRDNGFAQVDTGQDAWYFGTWANPAKLVIVCYCEGDVTLQTAESEQEFAEELRRIQAWNIENGFSFGIDPLLSDDLEQKFKDLGLGDLLH